MALRTEAPPAKQTRPALSANFSGFAAQRREFPPGTSGADWWEVDERLREQIADAINQRQFPVVIYGPPGTGKSCAMACLYRSYWHPNEQVNPQWLRLEEFISQVIRCRTSRDGRVEVINPSGGPSFFRSETQLFWIAGSTPVLFMDDVGIKPASDTGREIAHKMLSQRDKMQPTFISSNLSPEQLCDCYDSRIVSRICTGKVIHLHGADRRLEHTEFAELF